MTHSPPSSMVIELEEKDIRSDIPKIVNAMSKIRAECIKSKNASESQKDEYLHLTYRLASGIKALADGPITERMGLIAENINKNPALLRYDPMQDGYWKRREGEFTKTLDDLLINCLRDDFHDTDSKHHVLQAIKYLGVEGASFKEREEVYSTILPFQKALLPDNRKEKLIQRMFKRMFGGQYKAESLEDLILRVDMVKNGFSPELMDIAKEMGYTILRADIKKSEFDKIKPFLNSSQIIDAKTNSANPKLINFADNLVKYTSPVSYPFLGALPESLQKRLHDTLPRFNKEYAFGVSVYTEIAAALSGLVAIAIYPDILPYSPTIPSIFIDALIRGLKGTGFSERYHHSVGSVFLKPFFYPLEKYLDKIDRDKETLTVDIPLRKTELSQYIPNPISHYDEIARLDVPEDIEKNLEWGTGNHHSFGRLFVEYIRKNTRDPPAKINIDTKVDRESQSVIYEHQLLVGGYRKNSLLFCFNEKERYIVTAIMQNNGTEGFAENAARILSSGSDVSEKMNDLGRSSDMKYIHMIEYKNGQIVKDIEASS